ncbi:MAG: NAD(P)/FAD-dependent oxidoreductase [Clostridia bacterium]|nr:NAD(P)/FAD-dependent oxidoreductase [Clostridia bacterium]
MNPYLIIGNGVAAAGCIEGIRSVDPDDAITVVSAEKHPVYSRPLISYYLEGKTDLNRMQYRSEDFYETNCCTVIPGQAEEIDPVAGSVRLSDGTTLPYRKLCLATGSSPFVPPMAGLDGVRKKSCFMTVDDALLLESYVTKQSDALIIGAGLIGLKCAEGLRDRANSITVCDLADHVLSSILDGDSAAIVQRHLEANGLRFRLGDSVRQFSGSVATLQSGETIPFDVLVLAVGVRANTALLRSIGGEVGRGIVVNARMETSIPDIFAAGDCTEGFEMTSGQNRVVAILPNAYRQGFAAGVNMAGGDAAFTKNIPMNSIGLFGLHIMTAGSYTGAPTEERTETTLKRFYTDAGLLKGFILVGHTERAGIYTSLIREQTPLDTIDFEAMKKIASTSYFSSDVRRKKFGGVV